jgi:hypothetical protein
VEELWSPNLIRSTGKAQAKAHASLPGVISSAERRDSFSLRRGLDSI